MSMLGIYYIICDAVVWQLMGILFVVHQSRQLLMHVMTARLTHPQLQCLLGQHVWTYLRDQIWLTVIRNGLLLTVIKPWNQIFKNGNGIDAHLTCHSLPLHNDAVFFLLRYETVVTAEGLVSSVTSPSAVIVFWKLLWSQLKLSLYMQFRNRFSRVFFEYVYIYM